MRENGYTEPEFFEDLEQDTTGTVARLIRMFNAGRSEAAWQEIEKLHDEFIYFSIFDDEIIVCEAR